MQSFRFSYVDFRKFIKEKKSVSFFLIMKKLSDKWEGVKVEMRGEKRRKGKKQN